MATIASFVDGILPDLQGCPTPLIEDTVRRIFREVFEGSRLWRAELESACVPGEGEYELELPTDARIVAIQAVTIGISPLAPVTREQLDNSAYSWRDVDGTPRAYIYDGAASLFLYPQPTGSDAIYVSAVLAPTRAATTVPDQIMERYEVMIHDGVVARLAAMPGKPWTDINFANMRNVEYRRALGMAQRNVNTNYSGARDRVAMRSWT